VQKIGKRKRQSPKRKIRPCAGGDLARGKWGLSKTPRRKNANLIHRAIINKKSGRGTSCHEINRRK